MEEQLIQALGGSLIYSPIDVLVNTVLALILGLVIAWTYRKTHSGLSYSQSFVITLVFVTIIIGVVMMVVGNSLARAFALVGALSIIRFRTVVKDTKDITYVFMALAVGMAAGTGNYFIAVYSTGFLIIIAWALYKFRFGLQHKNDFILRFHYEKTGSNEHVEYINESSINSTLLHVEPSGDNERLFLTYDLSLNESLEIGEFVNKFAAIEGVSGVVLVNSVNDVNY